jgi:twitching motility protein PilT
MIEMDLDKLLERAVATGASDIHLKVGRPPMLRIDGTIGPMAGMPDLTEPDLEGCLHAITAGLPKRHAAFEEVGDLDLAYTSGELPRFRVNAFRQRGAISFAFRVIPKTVPRFEELGLPPGVQALSEEHRGLVLVTGATGSGKTTTLAAMIDYINRNRDSHIVTIEDPIEILHPDHRSIINQREVGLDTESFGQALRRALRQDPDTILIGELRDAETAQTALQAAESGHLVFSTLHTVDAAETIGRMIEFFPEAKQQQVRSIMAGVLRGIVSQRLLPATSGGRVAAVEVMIANARIADLIRENRADEISEAIAEGDYFKMQTFTQALISLVLAGRVDRELAANAASNRHDFLVALERAVKANAVTETNASESGDDRPAPMRPAGVTPAQAPQQQHAPAIAAAVAPAAAEQTGLRLARPSA